MSTHQGVLIIGIFRGKKFYHSPTSNLHFLRVKPHNKRDIKMRKRKLIAVDLFSGCGGLTEGLHEAGFTTRVAVEIDAEAIRTYKLNHPKTAIIQKDIRSVSALEIFKKAGTGQIHLLAGCPPCQGFSSMRRLNKKKSKRDPRNALVLEYLRLVKELRPLAIMMENVPALQDYYLFKRVFAALKTLGYNPKVEVVNVKDYGVPQDRRRLVLVGSILGQVDVAEGNGEIVTVRDAIGTLADIAESTDHVHKIIPDHSPAVMERIRLTPPDGGSSKDLPARFKLKCHEAENVGFNDVYGRLRWDDFSTTITGGCLNPSKGRFLHPERHRCISAREAALLQSFPGDYRFPEDISKGSIALQIGNALPPRFSYFQSVNLKRHLESTLGR